MTETAIWKVRPDDLRRVASRTREPERERKMLVLAELLEEAQRGNAPIGREGDVTSKQP
jgi:hypothetical protein